MSVRVGIIGAGVMGADHAATIARAVAQAELVAIFDADRRRAASVVEETGARFVAESADALISDSRIDAVLIASPDHTHAKVALACLAAGKPVLCEKPLAPTADECLRLVQEEARAARRLIQVGFMRRFDPAYLAMKEALHAGEVGRPLLFHSVHRNASAPSWFTSDMIITNSAVHDIDIARWLLDDEFMRAKVFTMRTVGAGGMRDPQFLVLEAQGGSIVDIEVFINAGYGYDIRGEVVCERGVVTLAPPVHVHSRHAGSESFGFAPDWRPRFAAAYENELRSWVESISRGVPTGASAWDGYVATAVAEHCLASLASGTEAQITLAARPDIYGPP